MQRKDREITDISAITGIIKKCTVCRLGLADGNIPYIVPLCFGYKDNALYFHGALKGLKIDMIRKNPDVCFEFDRIAQPVESEKACDWGMQYESVTGRGRAFFVENTEEKIKAMNIIMAQYSDRHFTFADSMLKATAVIRVEIQTMKGKCSGFS